MSAVDSDEQATKRRKVRKGTHSCWECKRRKVKCVFSSQDEVVCITCRRRSTACLSQQVFDGSEVAEETSGRAGLVQTVLSHPVGSDSGNVQRTPWSLPAGSTLTPSTSTSRTPASTLRENSPEYTANKGSLNRIEHASTPLIVPELPPTSVSSRAPIAAPNRHQKITRDLLNALPSQMDLEILLGKLTGISMLCYQCNLMSRSSTRMEVQKQTIQVTDLMHPETHPILLARQILAFAAGLQYLSPSEVIPGLTEHHHVIMDRLVESAISMVTMNDLSLGSLESLEIIIMEGFYHIDSGNIRRAWITMRRCVTVAQLLGLHRLDHYRYKVINDNNNLDPQVLWLCIVSMERLLSLLLGLPTNTIGMSPTLHATERASSPSSAEGSDMRTLLVGVVVKIIERNELRLCEQSLHMTQEIDQELIKVAEQMPSKFWRLYSFAGLAMDSEDAYWETRRIWDHMYYYTLVNQLHLPFMLCQGHVGQSVYSRIACVNASREILTREITFRAFNPITACCRLGDFLALIAGMTLMLAHIVSHCHKEMENILVHQRLSDRATVEQALECMESMSEVREDMLAARCAALLKHLLAIEADAAQGQTYHAHQPDWDGGGYEEGRIVLIIKVPYIGAIRIAREGITSMPPLKTAQDQRLHEDITVGGIGSLHVDNPADQDRAADTRPGSASNQAFGTPSNRENATRSPQILQRDIIIQQDELFPDAAAGVDDWAFQGFDTAFFDVLMQGAAASEQQLNSTGAEGWELGTYT